MACTCRSLCACKRNTLYLHFHRIALLNYREDGVTPFITFWKHGLEEMKV